MKSLSNAKAIILAAVGLFIIVFSFAIVVGLYELSGTKKAPLFAGELDEKIDVLSPVSFKEYITELGIQYSASTTVVDFSCRLAADFKVEELSFTIESNVASDSYRLFNYDARSGKTKVENKTKTLDVNSEKKLGDGLTKEDEGRSVITLEQLADALRFYLKHKEENSEQGEAMSLELKRYGFNYELKEEKEAGGRAVYIRNGGQYFSYQGEKNGDFFLLEVIKPVGSNQKESLYELEYY